jgi:molybdate transport system regulatory protein
MGQIRQSLKTKFSTPEKRSHLRVICATLGPGKARLLGLIAKRHSITEAAREMKMSYKRAWQLIDTLNGCFRQPLVESITGGTHGGGSRLTRTGKQVLGLYEAIHAKSLAAVAKDLKRLQGMLKT